MIEIKLENIAELRAALDPKLVNKALRRALADASRRVASQISRDVRARYNVKAGDINKRVTSMWINQDTMVGRLLVYTGARVSLARFSAKPVTVRSRSGKKRKGVSIQILKTNPRAVVTGGFLAQGRNAKEDTAMQIFKRMGADRLPVEKLSGPAIPQMVSHKSVIDRAIGTAGEVVPREFARQMDLLMSKTGAK